MMVNFEEIQNKMLADLNSHDFGYFKEEFGYSKWETIRKFILESYYGCSNKGSGYWFTPAGVTLKVDDATKFIKVNDLRKMFEKGDEQLSLF